MFILYFNGGSWVIGKESSIDAYWAGCPQIDLFDCDGNFWIHGTSGYDGDSSVTTQFVDVCTTSTADDSSSSLSVALYNSSAGDGDDSSSSGDSNSNNSDNNNKLEGWVWLLIGALIAISVFGIGVIYVGCCTNYKLINGSTDSENLYNLMRD